MNVVAKGSIDSNGLPIYLESTSGNIILDTTQALLSGEQGGVRAIASSGTVTVDLANVTSSGLDGIDVESFGNIDIDLDGDLKAITSAPGGGIGVSASSSDGSVAVHSTGTIEVDDANTSANAIGITAKGDIAISHVRSQSTNGLALYAESSAGDVTIDLSAAPIVSERGGLRVLAPAGSASLKTSRLTTGLPPASAAIFVDTANEIAIDHTGDLISTGGNSSIGILADSATSSITVNSEGDISSIADQFAGAISAVAETDVLIESAGNLDSFGSESLTSDGIFARSNSGNIDIKQSGNIDVSGGGSGIHAEAERGYIIVNYGGADNTISTLQENGMGIDASASQSVSIVFNGFIQTLGDGAHGIFAESQTAGVSIAYSGETTAGGANADGIRLSSPTAQTLTITSGSINGSDGDAAGVRFVAGAENRLTNHGEIMALNLNAILAGSGNETIDNHGSLFGNINLGEGTNVLKNHAGGFIFSDTSIDVGNSNTLVNAGDLAIGEDRSEIKTLTGDGTLEQTESGAIQIDVLTLSQLDRINMLDGATLAGSLLVHASTDLGLTEPATLEVLSAASIAGEFAAALATTAINIAPDELRIHAKNFPSRSIASSLEYTSTTVSVVLTPVSIENYDDWKAYFFPDLNGEANESAAPLADGDPQEDPDKDGLSNLEEYAFGTHPTIPSVPPVVIDVSAIPDNQGTVHTLAFNWAKDATSVDWQIEASQDLVNWMPLEIDPAEETDLGELIRYEFEYTSESKPLFLRVAVRESPEV